MRKNSLHQELITDQKQYRYYAFISYKTEDQEYANKIHDFLETYKLPKMTLRNHSGLDPCCTPVFIDKEHLLPGVLNDRLESALRDSKYLIVVCSRIAAANSYYLDKELDYFLSNGGDPSRVIPFIIDDCEKPEVNCFPSGLRELCETTQDIVGVNVFKEGERTALIKVIAAIHGISKEEVLSDDAKRKKKRMIMFSAVAVGILLVISAVGYNHWNYYMPKTFYYLDYVEKCGIPEGIGQLTDEEASRQRGHYRLTSSKNKVRELAYEDAHGNLLAVPIEQFTNRPAKMTYDYSESSGDLKSITCYNEEGVIVHIKDFEDDFTHNTNPISDDDNCYTVNLNRRSREQDWHYTGSMNLPAQAEFGEESIFQGGVKTRDSASEITTWIYFFDEQGYVKELHFATITNGQAYVVRDNDEIAGYRYERDALGRETAVNYLSYTGKSRDPYQQEGYVVNGTRNGYSKKSYEYEGDHLVRIQYFKDNETPAFYHGYSSVSYEYDENHNEKQRTYRDVDGELAFNLELGVVSLTVKYNDVGDIVEKRYYGLNNEPILCNDGYAVVQAEYNDKGKIVEMKALGTNDQPILCVSRYAAVKYEYDDQGRNTTTDYLDTEGNRTLIDDGYARVEMLYNKNDQITDAYYYGVDGITLVKTEKGYAHMKIEYDRDLGYRTCVEHYDEQDQPMSWDDDCFRTTVEYGRQGETKRIDYHGIDGLPCLSKFGIASAEYEYAEGFNTSVSFFGVDGESIESTSGYARAESEYDKGNQVTVSFFGSDGKPCLHSKSQISIIRSKYNDQGMQIEESYYGIDGLPKAMSSGIAKMKMEYNDYCSLSRTEFYDENDNRINNDNGYSAVEYDYDDLQRITETRYYDVDDRLALIDKGYAIAKTEYDDRGNTVLLKYYGIDGKPIMRNDGYSAMRQKYDERGNRITIAFFDEHDQPVVMNGKVHYARVEYEFDANGNRTLVAYYDASGKLMIGDIGYAMIRFVFDDNGSVVAAHAYNEKGEEVRIK